MMKKKQSNGFIQVPRDIINWEYFKDPNCLRILIYLMAISKWEDGEVGGRTIKSNEMIFSVQGLMKFFNLKESPVRTALDKLKASSVLSTKGTSQFTIGRLEGWAFQKLKPINSTSKSTSKSSTYGYYNRDIKRDDFDWDKPFRKGD